MKFWRVALARPPPNQRRVRTLPKSFLLWFRYCGAAYNPKHFYTVVITTVALKAGLFVF